MDIPAILTAVSLVIVALTGLYSAQTARRTARRVEDVHGEVKTANGITLAMLGDRAEGRRIQADVPHDDRTTSEQQYVDRLHDPTESENTPPPIRPGPDV